MKAIIYCRKSTDRSDRQQLSISSQEIEAKKIAQREWLEIVEIFKETKSAKEPWRPLFNEMMAMISSWKADCIVTWKLNRLARNPVDEWTIKWSIQNGIIKAIYTEWEIFKTWDNVLIMWMHFWMSTQYILDLQRDIKRGMKKKIENWWVCQKAPIWYINNKLEKSIEVDLIKSKWVKEIFELRKQKFSYRAISEKLFNKWITKDNWKPFSKTTLEDIVKNKFYLWYVKFKWAYYKAKYKTFISQKLFDEANSIYQWLYEQKNVGISYPFKWLLKDETWKNFTAYIKKWNVYYKSSSKSDVNINLNENKLDLKILESLKGYKMDNKFKELNKKIALKLLNNWKEDEQEELRAIRIEITKLKTRKQNLVDLRIEWEIDKNTYNEKLNDLVFKISSLENKEKEILGRKDEEKIIKGIELACSFYQSYKSKNIDKKSNWLRKNGVELFLSTKKELYIANNSFLDFIKSLNFSNGGANRARTGVYGVADRCITTLPWHHFFIMWANYMKN